EWAIGEMKWLNNNITKMMVDHARLRKAPVTRLKALATAWDLYDGTETTAEQVLDAAAITLMDPWTWLGVTSIAGAVAKPAAKWITKSWLRDVARRALISKAMKLGAAGLSVGAIEGGMAGAYIGGFDESVRSRAEGREFEGAVPATYGAAGAALGAGLVGSVYGVRRGAGLASRILRLYRGHDAPEPLDTYRAFTSWTTDPAIATGKWGRQATEAD